MERLSPGGPGRAPSAREAGRRPSDTRRLDLGSQPLLWQPRVAKEGEGKHFTTSRK